MNQKDIIKKAKERAKTFVSLSKDARTKNVLGRFSHEGWLRAPHIRQTPTRVFLQDAIWVGETIEPRVLELLPAIVIKCPRVFYRLDPPTDLKIAIKKLKKGHLNGHFKNIPLRDCYRWIDQIGRPGKYPSVLKSYRFNKSDLKLLKSLAHQRKTSEIQVIRDALRNLA